MSAVPTPRPAVRALAPGDLDEVIAVDAGVHGFARRTYFERRLAAARREPGLHAQFALVDGSGLLGFLLARVLAGEFGARSRALRLEAVGLRAERRGHGLGRRLYEALADWGTRHGVAGVRSAADWRDAAMLGWFAGLGFELAPVLVLRAPVDGRWNETRDAAPPPGDPEGREIDYARREAEGGNDHERAARDLADVRTMAASDLDAIVHIDRALAGVDRREYISARLQETLADATVRVSLVARVDGLPAGYLMARADLGDFGRTEPVAVIDTLGVDPARSHHGVGRSLVSQLFANLGALRVEAVETTVGVDAPALLGFFTALEFRPGQRLGFVRRLNP